MRLKLLPQLGEHGLLLHGGWSTEPQPSGHRTHRCLPHWLKWEMGLSICCNPPKGSPNGLMLYRLQKMAMTFLRSLALPGTSSRLLLLFLLAVKRPALIGS